MRIEKALTTYISSLKVTQGPLAGELFRVLPWQKGFIRGAFSTEGEAALSIARGNGKSTLCGAVACAAIDPAGPLHQPRAEVVLVAASLSQARIVFEHCLHFLTGKGHDLTDRKVWAKQDTVNVSRLVHKPSGAKLVALGSDPKRLHGLAPALVIGDEPAQWQPQQAEQMISALRTALGKIAGAKLLTIGTRPAAPDHFFAVMLRDAEFALSFDAPRDDPPGRKTTWLKANPSLPHMPELEKVIRREWKRAKKDPAILASFRSLRLNQGTSDVQRQPLLDADSWRGIEGDAAQEGDCVWGIDLATNRALAAIVGYWPASGRMEAVCAFPHEPNLEDRGLRDGVGRLYSEAWKRDELILCGEAVIDVPALLAEGRARFGNPAAIAVDRWREAELRQSLKATGLPVVPLEIRGMGWKDGSEDVRRFQEWCLDSKVSPVSSLLLTASVGFAETIADPAGNLKLDKKIADDAAVAATLAVGCASRRVKPENAGGVYLGLA